ncbi:MAG: metal ABC transporter permease [Sciscionella sp.]
MSRGPEVGHFFDFSLTFSLLGYVASAVLSGAILGVVAGVISPLIVMRNMAFSVHATAEVAFAGGAAALLIGVDVGYGAIAAAVITALVLGVLSQRSAERDSVIGVVLTLGLGLGVLCLSLYQGRAGNKFGLLIGQIFATDSGQVTTFAIAGLAVVVCIALLYRPLLFASVDPDLAAARGVPTRLLTPAFAVLVGVSSALAVQLVGSLLVVSLMITPGAAAARVTASPLRATLLAVVFAEVAMLGGILLSIAPGLPASAFVTTISFLIYLGCRAVGSTARAVA